MFPECKNDVKLLKLLAEVKSPFSLKDVQNLIEGQISAPMQYDCSAWMNLVVDNPSDSLKQCLTAFEDKFRIETKKNLKISSNSKERLTALRNQLSDQSLDGFLVPLADEHQSEFPSLRAQRLAWLTGFTGSSGLAIVLTDKAVIFVDGRYTLQVRRQVDQNLFEIKHIVDDPPATWLKKNAEKQTKIGYDPWLHTVDGLNKLTAQCSPARVKFATIEMNPIDRVWQNQPAPPLAPVFIHPTSLAGRSTKDKIKSVADTLTKNGANAAILTAPDSIAWVLNIRGGDLPFTPVALGFAILFSSSNVQLFMDPRKLLKKTKDFLKEKVSLRPVEEFQSALQELGQTKTVVQFSSSNGPCWIMNELQRAGAKVLNVEDPCILPKACKNSVELQGMRNAHIRDGVALCKFFSWLTKNLLTREVDEALAAEVLYKYRSAGASFRGLSFETISSYGENGAVVHYRVTPETNKNLEPGSLYLVDSGAQYSDGTTDVTRTLAIGKPSLEMQDRFTRVLKGHIGIATASFPVGTTGSHLDAFARRPLWDIGLDFDHGTGHGVGSYLGVHEGPQRISKQMSNVPLRPGMVVSNEPGYYKEGAFGIRIENLEIVRFSPLKENGLNNHQMLCFEVLTLAPIDINLVNTKIMTQQEMDWLNHYHERVRQTLSPLLDNGTAEWLKSATRAI